MTSLTRRHVLGAGGASALLGWAAPDAVGSAYRGDPPASAWAALDGRMAGGVLLPTDSAYVTAKQLRNPRWDSKRPLAVVQPANRADVAEAMKFATSYALTVAPRAGGHCYVGSSTGDGVMVLDLRAIHAVSMNTAKTLATVGSGAGLYNVHRALAAGGRTIPTGTCATVGAGGLTLGGGKGPESSGRGLTADRLAKAVAVLADGSIVTASPSVNADLFWALRGGGGGQVAVVTDFTYLTHPATNLGLFSLSYPSSAIPQVVSAWGEFILSAPNSTHVNLSLVANSAKTKTIVRLVGVTAAGAQDSQANAIDALIGVPPLTRQTQTMTYMQAVLYFSNGQTNPPRRDFTAGSDIVASVTSALGTALADITAEGLRRGVGYQCLVAPLTGAVRAPSPTATAFPWRRHTAAIQWFVPLGAGSSAAYTAARSWISYAHTRMGAMSVGAYVNYVEPGRPTSAYFAANLNRLRTVKNHYDPADRLLGSVSY